MNFINQLEFSHPIELDYCLIKFPALTSPSLIWFDIIFSMTSRHHNLMSWPLQRPWSQWYECAMQDDAVDLESQQMKRSTGSSLLMLKELMESTRIRFLFKLWKQSCTYWSRYWCVPTSNQTFIRKHLSKLWGTLCPVLILRGLSIRWQLFVYLVWSLCATLGTASFSA